MQTMQTMQTMKTMQTMQTMQRWQCGSGRSGGSGQAQCLRRGLFLLSETANSSVAEAALLRVPGLVKRCALPCAQILGMHALVCCKGLASPLFLQNALRFKTRATSQGVCRAGGWARLARGTMF